MLKFADFYKCYRAFVRGKVESLQSSSAEHANRAQRYFQLALRYATVGSEPLVLVVMGGIATGKSTVAGKLAREFDWPVFSSDRIRKTIAGISLTKRTSPEMREIVYSKSVTDQTYDKLIEEGLGVLARHTGVVLDATFSSRSKRDLLANECNKAGVRFQVIELEADRETVAKRLGARDDNAIEISDARLEDFPKLTVAYDPASEFAPNLIRASTSGEIDETLAAILRRLVGKQLALA